MKLFKKLFYPLLVLFSCKEVKNKPSEILNSSMSIYEIKIKTIEGKDLSLSDFKGKKILFVNVASECGYTPQYKQLQELYDLKKQSLEIIGVPANNFGGQEPGSNPEILNFCEKNYGVTFTLTEKVSVLGNDQHDLYNWLTNKNKNGWNDKSPDWNFCKYLVDEKGNLVSFFSSSVSPLSEEILSKF
jgi:glutathione peroxidase